MENKVKLTISGLTSDLEMGLSRKEISNKYGLAPTQIKKAMDKAGLKGMRAKMDKFELIDDTDTTVADIPPVMVIDNSAGAEAPIDSPNYNGFLGRQ